MTRANATNLADDLRHLFEDYGVRGSVAVGIAPVDEGRFGVAIRSQSPDVLAMHIGKVTARER